MESPLLPSEIARLVLGYLEEEKCDEAAQCFLEHSPHLAECLAVARQGRKFSTRVLGNTLNDLLDEYCAVHSLVAERLQKLPESSAEQLRQCGGLIDQLRFLLDATRSGQTVLVSITVPPQGGSPQGSNVSSIVSNRSRSWLQSSSERIKRTSQRWQLQDSKQRPKERDDRPSHAANVPPTEATPLESLPGLTGSLGLDSRSTQTSRDTSDVADNTKQTGETTVSSSGHEPMQAPSENVQENVVGCVNSDTQLYLSDCDQGYLQEDSPSRCLLQSSKTSLSDKDNANENQMTESTNASTSSPRRKSHLSKKKSISPNKSQSPIKPRRSHTEESEPSGSVALSLHRALLDNKELHEKIAENINRVMRIPNDTGGSELQTSGLQASSEPIMECDGMMHELNQAIKTIVDQTQQDPLFERFLEEIIGPAEEDLSPSPAGLESETEEASGMSEPLLDDDTGNMKAVEEENAAVTLVDEQHECEEVGGETEREEQQQKQPKSPNQEVPLKQRLRSARQKRDPANNSVSPSVAANKETKRTSCSLEDQNAAAIQYIIDAQIHSRNSLENVRGSQQAGKDPSPPSKGVETTAEFGAEPSLLSDRNPEQGTAIPYVSTTIESEAIILTKNVVQRAESDLKLVTSEKNTIIDLCIPNNKGEKQTMTEDVIVLDGSLSFADSNTLSFSGDLSDSLVLDTTVKKQLSTPLVSSTVSKTIGNHLTTESCSSSGQVMMLTIPGTLNSHDLCSVTTSQQRQQTQILNEEDILSMPTVIMCDKAVNPYLSVFQQTVYPRSALMMAEEPISKYKPIVPKPVMTSGASTATTLPVQLVATSDERMQPIVLSVANADLESVLISSTSNSATTTVKKKTMLRNKSTPHSIKTITTKEQQTIASIDKKKVHGIKQGSATGVISRKMFDDSKPSTSREGFGSEQYRRSLKQQNAAMRKSREETRTIATSGVRTRSQEKALNRQQGLQVPSAPTVESPKGYDSITLYSCEGDGSDLKKSTLRKQDVNLPSICTDGSPSFHLRKAPSVTIDSVPSNTSLQDTPICHNGRDKLLGALNLKHAENSVTERSGEDADKQQILSSTENHKGTAGSHTKTVTNSGDTQCLVKECDRNSEKSVNGQVMVNNAMSGISRDTPQAVGGNSSINTRRLSLSTPRRRRSHIRALDFGTPPKCGTEATALKRSNTSPKGFVGKRRSPGRLDSITKTIHRAACYKSPISRKNQAHNVRSSLFKSPDALAMNPVPRELVDNSMGITLVDRGNVNEIDGVQSSCRIATRSPAPPLIGDWDRVTGAGLIFDMSSPDYRTEDGTASHAEAPNKLAPKMLFVSPESQTSDTDIQKKNAEKELKEKTIHVSGDTEEKSMDSLPVVEIPLPVKGVNQISKVYVRPKDRSQAWDADLRALVSKDYESAPYASEAPKSRKRPLKKVEGKGNKAKKSKFSKSTKEEAKLVEAMLNSSGEVEGAKRSVSKEIDKKTNAEVEVASSSVEPSVQAEKQSSASIEEKFVAEEYEAVEQRNEARKVHDNQVEMAVEKNRNEQEPNTSRSDTIAVTITREGNNEMDLRKNGGEVGTPYNLERSSCESSTLDSNVPVPSSEKTSTSKIILSPTKLKAAKRTFVQKPKPCILFEEGDVEDSIETFVISNDITTRNENVPDSPATNTVSVVPTVEVRAGTGTAVVKASETHSTKPPSKVSEPPPFAFDTPKKIESIAADLSSLIPLTPRVLSPRHHQENTPMTKFLRNQPCIDFSMINTPSLPPTPKITITPNSEHSVESPVSYATRTTDYSSCSSYYNPTYLNTPSKHLEEVLIEECNRIETRDRERGLESLGEEQSNVPTKNGAPSPVRNASSEANGTSKNDLALNISKGDCNRGAGDTMNNSKRVQGELLEEAGKTNQVANSGIGVPVREKLSSNKQERIVNEANDNVSSSSKLLEGTSVPSKEKGDLVESSRKRQKLDILDNLHGTHDSVSRVSSTSVESLSCEERMEKLHQPDKPNELLVSSREGEGSTEMSISSHGKNNSSFNKNILTCHRQESELLTGREKIDSTKKMQKQGEVLVVEVFKQPASQTTHVMQTQHEVDVRKCPRTQSQQGNSKKQPEGVDVQSEKMETVVETSPVLRSNSQEETEKLSSSFQRDSGKYVGGLSSASYKIYKTPNCSVQVKRLVLSNLKSLKTTVSSGKVQKICKPSEKIKLASGSNMKLRKLSVPHEKCTRLSLSCEEPLKSSLASKKLSVCSSKTDKASASQKLLVSLKEDKLSEGENCQMPGSASARQANHSETSKRSSVKGKRKKSAGVDKTGDDHDGITKRELAKQIMGKTSEELIQNCLESAHMMLFGNCSSDEEESCKVNNWPVSNSSSNATGNTSNDSSDSDSEMLSDSPEKNCAEKSKEVVEEKQDKVCITAHNDCHFTSESVSSPNKPEIISNNVLIHNKDNNEEGENNDTSIKKIMEPDTAKIANTLKNVVPNAAFSLSKEDQGAAKSRISRTYKDQSLSSELEEKRLRMLARLKGVDSTQVGMKEKCFEENVCFTQRNNYVNIGVGRTNDECTKKCPEEDTVNVLGKTKRQNDDGRSKANPPLEVNAPSTSSPAQNALPSISVLTPKRAIPVSLEEIAARLLRKKNFQGLAEDTKEMPSTSVASDKVSADSTLRPTDKSSKCMEVKSLNKDDKTPNQKSDDNSKKHEEECDKPRASVQSSTNAVRNDAHLVMKSQDKAVKEDSGSEKGASIQKNQAFKVLCSLTETFLSRNAPYRLPPEGESKNRVQSGKTRQEPAKELETNSGSHREIRSERKEAASSTRSVPVVLQENIAIGNNVKKIDKVLSKDLPHFENLEKFSEIADEVPTVTRGEIGSYDYYIEMKYKGLGPKSGTMHPVDISSLVITCCPDSEEDKEVDLSLSPFQDLLTLSPGTKHLPPKYVTVARGSPKKKLLSPQKNKKHSTTSFFFKKQEVSSSGYADRSHKRSSERYSHSRGSHRDKSSSKSSKQPSSSRHTTSRSPLENLHGDAYRGRRCSGEDSRHGKREAQSRWVEDRRGRSVREERQISKRLREDEGRRLSRHESKGGEYARKQLQVMSSAERQQESVRARYAHLQGDSDSSQSNPKKELRDIATDSKLSASRFQQEKESLKFSTENKGRQKNIAGKSHHSSKATDGESELTEDALMTYAICGSFREETSCESSSMGSPYITGHYERTPGVVDSDDTYGQMSLLTASCKPSEHRDKKDHATARSTAAPMAGDDSRSLPPKKRKASTDDIPLQAEKRQRPENPQNLLKSLDLDRFLTLVHGNESS